MSSLMRAAIITAPGSVEIREVLLPEPQSNEVRVRLHGCGVCASNLPPWEGREWFHYPMESGALGHEGWGVVDQIGAEVTDFAVGQLVTLLSYHAYAEYDVAPSDSIVALPPELADTPFPGEPLGCALNIFRRSGIQSGQTVAIVGIGFLGVLLTRLAVRAGARVIAISRRESALEAAQREGASEIFVFDDWGQIIGTIKNLTDGKLCDVVVEAVGKQAPLDLAAELTKERGRLVIAGYHQDGLRQVNLQLWNWRGLDVINAHEREQAIYMDGIRAAINAVQTGELDPLPLYTHSFPLEQLGEALNTTRDRPSGFMKALVLV